MISGIRKIRGRFRRPSACTWRYRCIACTPRWIFTRSTNAPCVDMLTIRFHDYRSADIDERNKFYRYNKFHELNRFIVAPAASSRGSRSDQGKCKTSLFLEHSSYPAGISTFRTEDGHDSSCLVAQSHHTMHDTTRVLWRQANGFRLLLKFNEPQARETNERLRRLFAYL